jgi:hypothetical protein
MFDEVRNRASAGFAPRFFFCGNPHLRAFSPDPARFAEFSLITPLNWYAVNSAVAGPSFSTSVCRPLVCDLNTSRRFGLRRGASGSADVGQVCRHVARILRTTTLGAALDRCFSEVLVYLLETPWMPTS